MRLLLLAVLAVPLAAAQGAPEVVTDDVVVTAGRLPAEASETGRHVTALTAVDVARSTARSLDELLRFEAGVQVTPRGAFGAQADLSMRGGTFNGVVVLVDGARFNDPQTGHFLSDFPIPLAEIARVEVVRGPDAAAWGPDALGVVHVLTHAGLASRERGARVSVEGGSLGTVGGAASAQAVRGTTLVTAAAEALRTDGPAFRDTQGAPVVGSEGAVRADLGRVAGTVAVSRPLGRDRLLVRVAGDARAFGAAQFYTPLASDTSREATRTLWAQVRLSGTRGEQGWSVQAAGRLHTDEFTFFPGLTPNEHTSHRATVTAETRRTVSPQLTVGAGVSGEARGVRSNSLGDHGDASGGAFALARWRPVGRVTVSASGRIDADPGFGVEASPSASVALRPVRGVVLRAAGGRAVRAPNYTERYINTARELRSGNLGNPDLVAERAWSAEGGAEVRTGVLTLQATAFWRRTDGLIDYATTEVDGVEVFLAQNVAETTARGLETSAHIDWRFNSDQALSLALGYATTDVDADAGPGAPTDFRYALSHNPHLTQARAAAVFGRTTLTLEGLHKTRVDRDDVALVNARLALRVGPPRRLVEVTGEVRNALDAEYTEVFGAPMPGRTWLVGLRLISGR